MSESMSGAGVPKGPDVESVPKAEQTRRTRALIIRTTIDCIASLGYAQTTFLIIAQKAGISRGPLHYHFEDKVDLMRAVAEALPQIVDQGTMRTLRSAKGARERLAAIFEIAIDEHTGSHHFAAIELLIAARNDPALAEAVLPHFRISEKAMDDWWVNYLSDLNWDEERLLAYRHVMLAALRGLALHDVLDKGSPDHKAALKLFREVFVDFALGRSRDE